jgi:hypothetical protein
LITGGYVLHQLVLYMHAMMRVQQLRNPATATLKIIIHMLS